MLSSVATPSSTSSFGALPPATLSAASTVKPPTNTERRRKRACSSGERRSKDQDGVAHRPLASRGVAGAAAQERKTALQPGQQGRRSEEGDAGGGQLDGEWQALQPGADLRHGRGVRQAQGEVGPGRLGTPDEESHRRTRGEILEARGRRRVQQRQRGDDKDVFAGEAQHLAAGGEDLQVRSNGQEVGEERGRLDHLLDVVEQQQDVAWAQVGGQDLGRGRSPSGCAHLLQAQRPRDRREDEGGVGDRGQADEDDPVRELRGKIGGDVQGQPRLADAARPRQGDEADLVAAQQCGDVGGLALAADQRRPRPRQVRRC